MCLIAFAWNVHPAWPLVLIANRDEFHARPTAPLAPWDQVPGVYGGRDLRAGGGWLLFDPAHRRLAAVTNFREPPADAPTARSRGALVQGFMQSNDAAAVFAARVDAPAYGPYNLLLWDASDLVYASNRPAARSYALDRGMQGLSNGRLETRWPKTRRAVAALRDWLAQAPAAETSMSTQAVEPLLRALADERAAADVELPDSGVGLEMERMLSPPFIRGDEYGTRASTVLLIAASGAALMIERRFGPGGVASGETILRMPASAR